MAECAHFANASPETVVEEQKMVIHVQLSQDATPKSIAQDIITRLGEKPNGQQGTLWYRAHTLLKNLGVKLLVIDEVQHLASTGMRIEGGKVVGIDLRRTRSSPEALKTIMNRGTVPVVFAGTEISEVLLPGTQFNGRATEVINLAPLDWTNKHDQLEFFTFIGNMINKLMESGLLEEVPPLLEGETPMKLYLSSHGRLGLVCKIVQRAMSFVIKGSRGAMAEEDIAKAVDLFVAQGEISTNPFRLGRKSALELA